MSRHLDVFLPGPWSHQPGVKVSGWVQQNCEHTELTGTSALVLECGAFSLSLRPTAEQLRRLAALCTELADQIEHSEAPLMEAQQ